MKGNNFKMYRELLLLTKKKKRITLLASTAYQLIVLELCLGVIKNIGISFIIFMKVFDFLKTFI